MSGKECDNCKREFEPFELDNGETGYGFCFPKDDEPSQLMSDLTYAFCCFTDNTPTREPDKYYWCVKCVEAINEDDT